MDVFLATEIPALAAADTDADGQVELFTLAGGSVQQWAPHDSGVWTMRHVATRSPASKTQGRQLAVLRAGFGLGQTRRPPWGFFAGGATQ